MKRAQNVDEYFRNANQWHAELAHLREILKNSELTEEIKWGGPCYTFNGKNIVGIGGFKSYFGLWFHQGALLQDDKGVLINAQEGKTKALRQWRMLSERDIKPTIIKRYVKEAVGYARENKQIGPVRNRPIVVPTELQSALKKNKGAGQAFKNLRPGQQREYAEYISDARRDDTIARRIDKVLPLISVGGGLNDKYR